MKYLHKFETQTQFESYYNGENYEEPFVGLIAETSRVSYNKASEPDYRLMPLTVEVTAGSGELTLQKTRIKYKVNDGNWTTADSWETISVTSGDVIQFKQDYEQVAGSSLLSPLFSQYAAGEDFRFNIYGNVMSIYSENGFENLTEFTNEESNVFENLFSYCNVISAENLILPVTSLTDYCYHQMFRDCTSLTTAPELPATTLAVGCYQSMFEYCSSLATAPELPATTLEDYCYQAMFDGCSSLATAPSILPATTLAESCYASMFGGCTSLTTAPELPATTLVDSCYNNMFVSCSSLNYIKCLATDISADECTNYWVYGGVSPTGTFVKDATMTDWGIDSVHGIPTGWTVENAN